MAISTIDSTSLNPNQDLVIDGVTVGKGTGNYNTVLGNLAFNANTTGAGNAALSRLALYNNTTGNDNTSAGNSSLQANTTDQIQIPYMSA